MHEFYFQKLTNSKKLNVLGIRINVLIIVTKKYQFNSQGQHLALTTFFLTIKYQISIF